jgi:hypothetical protein
MRWKEQQSDDQDETNVVYLVRYEEDVLYVTDGLVSNEDR